MRTVFEARASTIVYRLVRSLPEGVVLLPANICPVVPLALILAEREFEHLDLDAETLTMSPVLLRERLELGGAPPVAAVLFVRTYGVERDVAELFDELHGRGIVVIDDRCLARPEPDPGEVDTRSADAVLYSTGYSKPVDLGFGGFAHLGDDVHYGDASLPYLPADLERVTELYQRHIRSKTPICCAEDHGERNNLAALRWLDTAPPAVSWEEHRRRLVEHRQEADRHRARLNAVYTRNIDRAARLDPAYHGWRFQVRLPDRDRALEEIFSAGYFASSHYFPAAVLFSGANCPVASTLSREILNLFNDFRVKESDAEALGRIVARHLEESSHEIGRTS